MCACAPCQKDTQRRQRRAPPTERHPSEALSAARRWHNFPGPYCWTARDCGPSLYSLVPPPAPTPHSLATTEGAAAVHLGLAGASSAALDSLTSFSTQVLPRPKSKTTNNVTAVRLVPLHNRACSRRRRAEGMHGSVGHRRPGNEPPIANTAEKREGSWCRMGVDEGVKLRSQRFHWK